MSAAYPIKMEEVIDANGIVFTVATCNRCPWCSVLRFKSIDAGRDFAIHWANHKTDANHKPATLISDSERVKADKARAEHYMDQPDFLLS